MLFYQACYGKPRNNWQLLNVSKDTPPQMVSFFESLGNSCTPQSIGSDIITDKEGNQIILYELISAENTICILRAKYGERDGFGRPKMFAHGFMFPAEGVYKDPAELLSISDSNFNFSDETTSDIPDQLKRDSKLSLEEALSFCNMDQSKWKQLMKCVYAMLSSPTDYPLYVQCNSNLITIKAAIMCILSALPFSLRYQLSFSNANSLTYSKSKRIMFVESVPEGSNYFNLESSETNLLSEISEIDQYPERYEAYHAFADMPANQFEDYCNDIQYALDRLSFGYAAELDETNLAHLFISGTDSLESFSDTDLMKLLLELLVKAPMNNNFADDYISEVLKKLVERALIPTDAIFKRIEQRSYKTSSDDFIDAYKKVRMRALLSKGNSEVFSFLGEQYEKSKDLFGEWVQMIRCIPDGEKTIEQFFEKKIGGCHTYEEVVTVHEEILRFFEYSNIMSRAVGNQLNSIARKRFLESSISNINYEMEFDVLKRVLDNISTSNREKNFDAISKGIILDFWKKLDYSDFEFNKQCVDNCYTMRPGPIGLNNPFVSTKFANLWWLSRIYREVEKCKEGLSEYWNVEDEVIKYDESRFHKDEAEVILSKLKDYLYKSLHSTEGSRHFCTWMIFIQLGEETHNPIPAFMRLKLPVVCDPECFEEAFKESKRMRKMGSDIKRWLSAVIDDPERYHIGADDVKTLKKNLKFTDDYYKEKVAEDKRKLKEQRKSEKKTDDDYFEYEPPGRNTHAEKEPEAKKSLLGGLFGGKKKG